MIKRMATTEFLTSLSEFPSSLPDHTQLPEANGTFVKNFQEHPQSILLTDSLTPILQQIHPDGQYCLGQDCGIYWRLTAPPEKGAEAPDWFYVPNVPPLVNDQVRRSYVLWQEIIASLIVLEFVSGNGQEERDRTPYEGKFWVYEQAIRVPFYGSYEVKNSSLEVYHLIEGYYRLLTPNERGHYSIPPLEVELGIWQGQYQNIILPWLRWWDAQGNFLLIGEERAQIEYQRAEQAGFLLQQERLRVEQLQEKLRKFGVDPDETIN